jgi:hypothetical protein
VPVRDLPDALPPSTARVTPAERAAALRARRAHLAWRFRT